jgi:hypothetical protein
MTFFENLPPMSEMKNFGPGLRIWQDGEPIELEPKDRSIAASPRLLIA